jgi:hypothetical protein
MLSGYFRAATPFILLDALAHQDRLQDSSPERAINCRILQPIGFVADPQWNSLPVDLTE